MIYAEQAKRFERDARLSSANGGSNTVPLPTASRSRRTPVQLHRLPPEQWKSARTTNAIETAASRSSSDGSRPKLSCLHQNRRDVVLALLASGRLNMRKVDGWKTLAEKPIASAN